MLSKKIHPYMDKIESIYLPQEKSVKGKITNNATAKTVKH